MDSISIEVLNWTSLNGRSDIKRCTWFKVDQDILQSESLHGLTAEERWVWIGLLAICSKRNSDTKSKSNSGHFTISVSYLTHAIGLTEAKFFTALEKLKRNQCITYSRTDADGSVRICTDADGSGPKTETETERESEIENESERRRDLSEGGLKTRTSAPKKIPETAAAWEAYSAAYSKRYGTEPTRNGTTNSQMAAFVRRIGKSEAPAVAEFYIWHNDFFYVKNLHPVGLLLKDAEKLRTEWATGKRMNGVHARQVEKTQANYDVFSKLIAEAEAKEAQKEGV
jgi:hypothetical protein